MSHLYWSCSHDVQEEVLHLLAENGREANVLGSDNGMPIISISCIVWLSSIGGRVLPSQHSPVHTLPQETDPLGLT